MKSYQPQKPAREHNCYLGFMAQLLPGLACLECLGAYAPTNRPGNLLTSQKGLEFTAPLCPRCVGIAMLPEALLVHQIVYTFGLGSIAFKSRTHTLIASPEGGAWGLCTSPEDFRLLTTHHKDHQVGECVILGFG